MGTNSGANTVERQELRKNRAGNKCRGKCHQGVGAGVSHTERDICHAVNLVRKKVRHRLTVICVIEN